MEEILTPVINALSETPSLAVWALVVVYAYKAIVVGSIYGVIRFCVTQLRVVMTTPKHTLEKVEIEAKLRSLTIPDCHEDLIAQIDRLAGVHVRTAVDKSYLNKYIHKADVRWLREAIDAKLEKDTNK